MTGAARTAASKLLPAPELPAATATLVLHGQQVALQVRESIGHGLELYRILLGEASYAGTSWVAPGDDRRPALRPRAAYDHRRRHAARGLGPLGWDDEGVAARRTTPIHAGVLQAATCPRWPITAWRIRSGR